MTYKGAKQNEEEEQREGNLPEDDGDAVETFGGREVLVGGRSRGGGDQGGEGRDFGAGVAGIHDVRCNIKIIQQQKSVLASNVVEKYDGREKKEKRKRWRNLAGGRVFTSTKRHTDQQQQTGRHREGTRLVSGRRSAGDDRSGKSVLMVDDGL